MKNLTKQQYNHDMKYVPQVEHVISVVDSSEINEKSEDSEQPKIIGVFVVMEKFGKSLAELIDPRYLDWNSSSSSDICSVKLKGNMNEEHIKLILRNSAKVM